LEGNKEVANFERKFASHLSQAGFASVPINLISPMISIFYILFGVRLTPSHMDKGLHEGLVTNSQQHRPCIHPQSASEAGLQAGAGSHQAAPLIQPLALGWTSYKDLDVKRTKAALCTAGGSEDPPAIAS
jgi:hypothetical protein